MIKEIRDHIWDIFVSRVPEGCIIPKPLLVIKSILFPIGFLRYILSINHGYDWRSDIWNINGVKYTGKALRSIANSQGEIFRVIKKGEYVEMVRVDNTDQNIR